MQNIQNNEFIIQEYVEEILCYETNYWYLTNCINMNMFVNETE